MGKRSGKAVEPSYAVGFVGGGNMATAMIRGFIAAGLFRPGEIIASDVDTAKRAQLRREMGIAVTADNAALVRAARVIVLAVKPQVIDAVLAAMRDAATPRKLFISIAAGVSSGRIAAALGGAARVVRVMPNTPALLGKAMSVVVRGGAATAADEETALRLLRAVGRARAVRDEALLDAVTGLSGSGPAYVYRFAEALIEGGVAAGLDRELASELALQTIAGAAAMLLEAGESPQRLRAAVTSPGGTTQAGLEEMARLGFANCIVAAVVRASERSRELGNQGSAAEHRVQGAGGRGQGAGKVDAARRF